MNSILYRGGYKYQLQEDYILETPIKLQPDIRLDFISLYKNGYLLIRKGYCWDGPSGPMPDFSNAMRGSLVHDALYQLMREGHLDREKYKHIADQLLHDICVEDGMSHALAHVVWEAVHFFGKPETDPANEKPPIWAPKEPSST